MENLFFEPIKHAPWSKQRDKLLADGMMRKPIDEMSFSEIGKMYDDKRFLCDVCGKELGECNYTLEQHIMHLIHPNFQWACDRCIQDDIKHGRVIGS